MLQHLKSSFPFSLHFLPSYASYTAAVFCRDLLLPHFTPNHMMQFFSVMSSGAACLFWGYAASTLMRCTCSDAPPGGQLQEPERNSQPPNYALKSMRHRVFQGLLGRCGQWETPSWLCMNPGSSGMCSQKKKVFKNKNNMWFLERTGWGWKAEKRDWT